MRWPRDFKRCGSKPQAPVNTCKAKFSDGSFRYFAGYDVEHATTQAERLAFKNGVEVIYLRLVKKIPNDSDISD